jgi:hypothetical protein
MLPPVLADFPITVISEAARAINMQEAARVVLLSSARAESPGAGQSGPHAVAALDARFDELGAEAIEMGFVVCELDPLATALCVYPITQLAYHLYVTDHAPAVRIGPDLVAISAALSFAPGGVFNIDNTFTAFCVAHHSAINEHILFDGTSCVANIIKALSRVKGQVIEISGDWAR